MKYKKILKWELFLGFFIILIINFFLLNLLVNTTFKNALDKEINTKLKIISKNLVSEIPPIVFSLTKEDKNTIVYKKYYRLLNKTKSTWNFDISIVNSKGKINLTTKTENFLLDRYILTTIDIMHSITFFENGKPYKTFIYPYEYNKQILGYVIFHLTENALQSFVEVKKMHYNIMILMFTLALITAFLFSSIFTKRIESTVNSLEKISKGETEEISVKWIDELSYLQDSINKMIKEIKEMENLKQKEMQIIAMGLAHEIKNPVTSIFSMTELLLRRKENLSEDVKKKLEKIREEIIRLTKIIDKFIHFAREKEVIKEKVKLNEFFYSLKEFFNFKLKFINIPENFSMNIDPVLFERALKNILKNSLENKATDIQIQIEKKNHFLEIYVIDDSMLIPDNIKDKIFIPFFSTKQSGMGIGLAITKNIIEKHKGMIKYIVKDNKNCFYIKLPIE